MWQLSKTRLCSNVKTAQYSRGMASTIMSAWGKECSPYKKVAVMAPVKFSQEAIAMDSTQRLPAQLYDRMKARLVPQNFSWPAAPLRVDKPSS